MYCSHLSMLNDLLTDNQIEELNNFFGGLVGSAVNNITISKVAKAILITTEKATKVMTKYKEAGIVKTSYGVRCPECNTLIKRLENLADIPEGKFICYSCEEDIEITASDIEVLFSLVDQSVFNIGQQEVINDDTSARLVAQEDTLESILLAGGVNEYLFSPTEQEYQELDKMYKSIFGPKKTTKDVGDTLEGLVIYLFNLCPAFRSAGIRITTNQIDCYVRNKIFFPYGVLSYIGGQFVIECKNEKKTPKGDYMSKIHSIITTANGKRIIIKFGIIVSKCEGPKTFRQLANKYYLINNLIVISICGDEIGQLIKSKGNLLELIERKINEIVLDSTTDLISEGLYEF